MRSLFVIFLLKFAICEGLNCYDCGPDSKNACLQPRENNVKINTCTDQAFDHDSVQTGLGKIISDTSRLDGDARANTAEKPYECYSLYFNSDIEPNGVYRGCVPTNVDVLTGCELLKEYLGFGNVTHCKTCSENECNVHDVGGGAGFVALSFSAIVVNALVYLSL